MPGEPGQPTLWDILNDLKNQWEKQHRELTARVNEVMLKLAVLMDRQDRGSQIEELVKELDRRLDAQDTVIQDLLSRVPDAAEMTRIRQVSDERFKEKDNNAAMRNIIWSAVIGAMAMGVFTVLVPEVMRAFYR